MRSRRRQATRGGAPSTAGMASMASTDTGYAAGEDGPRFGIWANGGHTWTDNDFVSTDFDGSITTGLVGVDGWVLDRLLIGGFGGVERTDLDTDYNLGELDGRGYTVGGYGSFIFAGSWALEAQVGATFTDLDIERTSLLTGVEVTGDTDSDRIFGSIGFTGDVRYDYDSGSLFLTPTVRHIFAQESVDDFTDSEGVFAGEENIELGILQVGGRMSYLIGNFEPFIGGFVELTTFATDTKVAAGPQPVDDRANGDIFGGLDFYAGDFISGGVEVDHKFEMRDQDETTISANISFSF
jgi:uncharacterized protein with beta-barrel porin domain